jgi:hypothetical protein
VSTAGKGGVVAGGGQAASKGGGRLGQRQATSRGGVRLPWEAAGDDPRPGQLGEGAAAAGGQGAAAADGQRRGTGGACVVSFLVERK